MDMVRWIPPDAQLVVELGCKKGETGKQWLRRQPVGEYVGVEEDASLAAAAVIEGNMRIHALAPHTVSLPQLGIFKCNVDCIVVRESALAALGSSEELRALLQGYQPFLKENVNLVREFPNARFL